MVSLVPPGSGRQRSHARPPPLGQPQCVCPSRVFISAAVTVHWDWPRQVARASDSESDSESDSDSDRDSESPLRPGHGHCGTVRLGGNESDLRSERNEWKSGL